VIVPRRYEVRRPQVSATTPVGTSKIIIPAVKKALAANASRLESPASSRKSVLMPQMNDAASVFPSSSVRYVRWMRRASGFIGSSRACPRVVEACRRQYLAGLECDRRAADNPFR
jgi:hypothetical protein